jgi:hypothetical protein
VPWGKKETKIILRKVLYRVMPKEWGIPEISDPDLLAYSKHEKTTLAL